MASLQYVNGEVYGSQGDRVEVDRVLAIGKEGFSCRVAGHDGQSVSIKEFRYLVSNINIEIPVKKSRLRGNRCWILDQWNWRIGAMLWGFTFLIFAFFASKL
ncbi:hypothetical protein [Undibacterium crateris]|uniref:hypothetical protein n=1 Tax=Undibacterium crateris TaxID=2528175 RepID=UPI00138941C1|nr:hypothetical protein [Undibacterium crateris]NDI84189.1 hypothetical protein [Undibacterium crateris]